MSNTSPSKLTFVETAVRKALRAADIDDSELVDLLGCDKATVSRMLRKQGADRYLHASSLPAVVELVGPAPLELLVRRCGFDPASLRPLIEGEAGTECVTRAVLQMGAALGALQGEVMGRSADGVLCRNDRDVLRDVLTEMDRQSARVRALLGEGN